eukprot:13283594-Alexandrium_andersonii.AAC.1
MADLRGSRLRRASWHPVAEVLDARASVRGLLRLRRRRWEGVYAGVAVPLRPRFGGSEHAGARCHCRPDRSRRFHVSR